MKDARKCLKWPFFSCFGQETIRSQIVPTKDFNSQFIMIGLKVKYLEEKDHSLDYRVPGSDWRVPKVPSGLLKGGLLHM